MCGRYTLTSPVEVLEKRFRCNAGQLTLFPRYNIAPGQECPVVVVEEEKLIKMMKWGLVPFWAEDASIGNKMINARAESVRKKPSYRKCFKDRRCLVLADGFFEWGRLEGRTGKVPIRYTLKSGEPFAFAGMWEKWKSPEGEILYSFTIITTDANSLIKPVHNRMPVILKKEDETTWLDHQNSDPEELEKSLKPFPSDQMEGYEVSTVVNSPTNDTESCIEPVNKVDSSNRDESL